MSIFFESFPGRSRQWPASAISLLLLLPASPRIASAATVALAPASADAFDLKTFAKGLSQPTDIALLPDGRAVVTQRLGDVVVFDSQGKAVRDPPAQIAVTPAATDPVHGTEQGLLSVAVDPNFSSNKTLYFYASVGTDPERKNQVLKIALADDGTLGPATPLLKDQDPGIRGPWNHNGGGLAIYKSQLYIGVGDTGHNKSPPNNRLATCLNSPNGKILRINLDGSVPSDNPLSAVTTVTGCSDWDQPLTPQPPDKRIFAWGVRNPFRLWADQGTGNLWVGDVGENTREEVSIVGKGQHMGWPFVEGTKVFDRKTQDFQPTNSCMGISPPAACTPPVYDYPHENNRKCIIGGLIATDGCEWPAVWRSKYFFGDYTSGEVFTLDVNADRSGVTPVEPGKADLFATVGGMSSFRMGFDNALYIVEVTTGAVERITPKGKGNVTCASPDGGSVEMPVETNDASSVVAEGAPGVERVDASLGGSPGSNLTSGVEADGAGGSGTGGVSNNGSAPSVGAESGCACTAARAEAGPAPGVLLAASIVTALGRRRRRDRRGVPV